MSEYIVTARKWRPMKFDDVAGQHHVIQTLQNAVRSGRIAHAYVFSGPRGVGKTTTARLLAKAVNCLNPGAPEECEVCREITEGRSFDVIEIDGASNRGVDEIRNLRESVRYAPQKARYKVYIIDEVHMLTPPAFNALLKTLEEPPPNIMFIFATTEIQKVPATILSRCQRFDFRRIGMEEIKANITKIAAHEKVSLDHDALTLIARKGDGSLRDAQSFFDQVVALCGSDITQKKIIEALNIVDTDVYFRITDLVKKRDAGGMVAIIGEMVDRGYDLREFTAGLAEHLRNMLLSKATGSAAQLEVSDVDRARYTDEITSFETADILRMLKFVNGTENGLRWSTQPRFKLEADMIQLLSLPQASEVQALILKIDELKKKLESGPKASVPTQRIPVVERAFPVGGQQENGHKDVPSEVRPTATPTFSLPAADEVVARWPEVIAELKNRQKLSLSSVLETSSLLGVAEGSVRIGCSNEFQSEAIVRQREVLSDVLLKVMNTRASVKVEVVKNPISPGPRSGSPSKPGQSAEDQGTTHPVIQALVRELGAEPLE